MFIRYLTGAGLPSTPGHLTRAPTFGERSSFAPLARLDASTSAHVLVAPAADLGVPWMSQALMAVERSASGYPYFLQLLGAATWDAARPERGTPLTVGHAQDGVAIAREQLAAMFRARWEAATRAEQDFIHAMAMHPDPDHVPRAAIAAA